MHNYCVLPKILSRSILDYQAENYVSARLTSMSPASNHVEELFQSVKFLLLLLLRVFTVLIGVSLSAAAKKRGNSAV